jgi:integrase
VAEQLVKRGAVWYYRYTDADGTRRMRKGCTDKRETERMAATAEIEQARIKARLVDPRELAYRDHGDKPLAYHLADWTKALEAKGSSSKHVELFAGRARRVVAILMGAKLREIEPPKIAKRAALPSFELALSNAVATARRADLTAERVQGALATLKADGRSLATCNHHRAAIKAFSKWCYDTHRAREDSLRGVTGFNAKEDRRHDRRTVSLAELLKLIEVAQNGPTFMGMTGPARALSYRLAVATGLRYKEIGFILPESFDWEAPSVTIAACYTKNGDPATLPLPAELVEDLAAYVAPLNPKMPIFPLPLEKGAKMLRRDLQAAGIPYRDNGGLVFDFHSLRCEMATLADAAGVSPRVVQKMMRHSSLELTGRYTRPRAVDIEYGARMLPSLKPSEDRTERIAMTGTDSIHVQTLAPSCIQSADVSVRCVPLTGVEASLGEDFSINEKTPDFQGFEALSATFGFSAGSTGDGTRTHDLRIMRPPL